jgi:chromate reductase, NAD(P)H dehydrogenase (quinone)
MSYSPNPMKLFALAGSTSSRSINRQLVSHVLTYFDRAAIDFPQLIDFEMPIYSIDREKTDGIPAPATDFIARLAEAQGIILSVAEHNRSFTAAFKNHIDWCSRAERDFFKGKPLLLLSTSPGGFGAGNSMNLAKGIFPKMGAEIAGTFSLPAFKDNFSADEGILSPELKEALHLEIEKFKQAIGY